MRLDVSHTFADIGKRLERIKADISEKVIARTLNKVVDGARGQMSSAIADEFMIKKGDAAKALQVSKATFKASRFYMQATLSAPSGGKRKGFNLIRFVQGKRIVGGWGKPQLKFKIKRAGPAVNVKGAFIGNQGRTVFIRKGKERQPIKALATIDVPQMFNTKRVNARVVKYINERLPIVMQQEIANVLRVK